MVFRYWGDAHADAGQFGTLVERHAGGVAGIAADVLTEAVANRGWKTTVAESSIEDLTRHLSARQPVIVLIADGAAGRAALYHYVVVVGVKDNLVVVHDPSWGPYRNIKRSTFEAEWSAARYWSLVVLPSSTAVPKSTVTSPDDVRQSEVAETRCDALLNDAIAAVAARGFDSADTLLADVRRACPDEAGAYRELAGVRFVQRRFEEAAALAHDALARDSNDSYANEVLGSSLYMLDDAEGALRAWNRNGKPRLDLVTIEGVHHTRYQSVAEAVGLTPNALLTADAFAKARHRVDELPDRSLSRLSVRPQMDGFATVDVAIAEGAGPPRDGSAWIGVAGRAAIDREVSVSLPGFSRQGEVWTASWRWFQNRPRAAIAFATPRLGRLPGIWRVDGSWEAESYGDDRTTFRTARKHGGLSVSDWLTGSVRYSAAAGADIWEGSRRAMSLGGSLERRWRNDRVALAGMGTAWLPIDGGPAFSAGGGRAGYNSDGNASRDRVWGYRAVAGVELVSRAAPLSLWAGAGEGRARAALLRAHPLLDGGVIRTDANAAFGRTLVYGTAEIERQVARLTHSRLALAAFVDMAQADRRFQGTPVRQADIGAGVRIRVPGLGKAVRVDAARGLADGAGALTIGIVY